MVTDYKILADNHFARMEAQVKHEMKQRWKPQGGLSHTLIPVDGKPVSQFFQAMVRTVIVN